MPGSAESYVADCDSGKLINKIEANTRKGEFNGDGIVNLSDAIFALKNVSSTDPGHNIYKTADVNGDDKIGIEEAIYVLEKVVGRRE